MTFVEAHCNSVGVGCFLVTKTYNTLRNAVACISLKHFNPLMPFFTFVVQHNLCILVLICFVPLTQNHCEIRPITTQFSAHAKSFASEYITDRDVATLWSPVPRNWRARGCWGSVASINDNSLDGKIRSIARTLPHTVTTTTKITMMFWLNIFNCISYNTSKIPKTLSDIHNVFKCIALHSSKSLLFYNFIQYPLRCGVDLYLHA